MKMDVIQMQDKIGALRHKSAFNLLLRLVLLTAKRLRVALSLCVLKEGAVHHLTTNASGVMAVLRWDRFTLPV